jgi:hypothetical protein
VQSADRVVTSAPPLVRQLRAVSGSGVSAGVAIPVGVLLLAVLSAGAYLVLQRRGGSPPLEVGAEIVPPAPEPTPTAVTAPLSLEDELDQLVAAGTAGQSTAATATAAQGEGEEARQPEPEVPERAASPG